LGVLRRHGAARRAGSLALLPERRTALPPPGRPRRPDSLRQQRQSLGQPRRRAPYRLGGDATLDLTLPDAAPADVVVLDASGRPVSGTMHYSAVAHDPVPLAPGVDATATATDDIADTGGHFAPLLFGPSAFTFSVDDGAPSDPVTVSPGEAITLHLADQSGTPGAPQAVTATAGDGKVKVTWAAPASDGGSPITTYTVTASHNNSNFRASFGAGATSGTIRNLVNGKTYSVTVQATNANGVGP